jgi:hypothetical protein
MHSAVNRKVEGSKPSRAAYFLLVQLPKYMQQRLVMEFTPEFFDASSRAWRANKRRYGESWRYVCTVTGCNRDAGDSEMCIVHRDKGRISEPKAEGKKLNHGYFLRSRSQHADLHPPNNYRTYV